ncbi:type II secretion system F family protein [Lichenibacterium ramalinae]|uniref:Type II secretion system F family protein n=1 Tax=Lichenibacterium ramalinae TaxID=2316527 RepID=A0A4Q2RC52_9HYPH|nr:type II secretion system F family protein [Lichenibacterium ramalinae]RYB04088.1 type II secretion system F family protein [Lichenibacterium ramalinae]
MPAPGLFPYRYRAYRGDGSVVVATIDAASPEAAVAAVYDAGLTPFETVRVAARGDRVAARRARSVAGPAGPSDRLSLKELRAFTVELATLTLAELPLDEAMRSVAGPGAKPKAGRLARSLLADLLGGAQLSEAMARHPRSFPPDYRAIVGAGEAGAALPRVLGELAEALARRVEVRGKLLAAMVYPAILLAMSLASVGVIVAVLVPNLTPIFTDAGLPLPGILGTLVAARDASGAAAAVALAVGLALAGLARAGTRDPMVRLAADRLLVRLPVLGAFLTAGEAARFLRGLGTLIGAGVPMMGALRIALDLVANRDLARRYAASLERVPNGESLTASLGDAALVPASALRFVALGEETGRLGPMLSKAAGLLEGDQQRAIDRLLSLLTPVMTLAVGGAVGALIMSVMGAVLSINDLAFK